MTIDLELAREDFLRGARAGGPSCREGMASARRGGLGGGNVDAGKIKIDFGRTGG